MVLLDQVVGHKNIIGRLKLALTMNPRPAQGFLFCGPSGIGKKLIAMGWAQSLLCEKPNHGVACGKCNSCLRVEKKHHPDLMIIAPVEAATIKVDQVRDIQNFVSLKSFEGQSKVVIIDEAQTMGPQASNALLKTLEEPPENCYFVLITANKAAILPTIQSRCQKVLFGSLTTTELKKILPQTEPWVLELAQGRVDAALKISDESFRELRNSALGVLKNLFTARNFEGFTSVEPLCEDRDSALFTVQCWAQWVRQATALKLGAQVPQGADEASALKTLIQGLDVSRLLTLSEKISRLENDIHANINKSLAFEKFWMDAHSMELKNV